jgi:predicted lipoprotein with Yx(FWY)xxD motif
MKRLIPVAFAAAAIAVVVAGCGSSNGGGGSATAASSSSPPPTTIKTAKTKLGTFLVDGQGRTLYLFEADKPNMSNCSGGCTSIWPPLSAKSMPKVSGGVAAGKVGTTKTPSGGSMVTYNGHPLYTYTGDTKAGDVNGQGLNQFGAEWYVVKPSGEKIDND